MTASLSGGHAAVVLRAGAPARSCIRCGPPVASGSYRAVLVVAVRLRGRSIDATDRDRRECREELIDPEDAALPARDARVRIVLDGRPPMIVYPVGRKELGRGFIAIRLPDLRIVREMIAYDDQGRIIYHGKANRNLISCEVLISLRSTRSDVTGGAMIRSGTTSLSCKKVV